MRINSKHRPWITQEASTLIYIEQQTSVFTNDLILCNHFQTFWKSIVPDINVIVQMLYLHGRRTKLRYVKTRVQTYSKVEAKRTISTFYVINLLSD